MSKLRNLLIGTAFLCAAGPAMAEPLGLGRAALPEEIAAWDLTVLPDGTGLRPGSGDVATGEEVFAEKCAVCHGDFAEGLDSWPVLAGGDGSLRDARPVKTVGSYWPHLSTVWDYVHRSMPFGQAQTVSIDETYAITAFLLYSNGLVEDDFTLTDQNFAEVVMPNKDGFYEDDRAETEYGLFSAPACQTDCATPVTVTKRAADLKVTPADEAGKPLGTLPNLELAAAGAAVEPAAETLAEAAAEAPAEAPVETAAVDAALIEAGAKVFKKCAACHKVGEGAKNGVGPLLNGSVGRPLASVEGFKYSKGMIDKAAEVPVWDQAALDAYLENPKGYVKGTKMSFAGLKKAEDRAAVIAYLAGFAE